MSAETWPTPPKPLSPQAVGTLELILHRGEIGIEELGNSSPLPPVALNGAVDELARAGFVRLNRQGAGSLYVCIGSQAALHGLLSRPGARTATVTQLLRARLMLESMARVDVDGVLGIDSITDNKIAWERLEALGRSTRLGLISLHAGEPPDEEELLHSVSPVFDLIERQVPVRIVCPRSFAVPAHIRRVVTDLGRRGVYVRFADALPHRLVVSDVTLAAVPLGGTRLAQGSVFVHKTTLVQSLQALAERIFRRGVPLDDVPVDGSDIGPSPIERRVVSLLGSGVTDEVAARQLSITDRQYRRYVSKVMSRLGATSRFQAGVRATERGWI